VQAGERRPGQAGQGLENQMKTLGPFLMVVIVSMLVFSIVWMYSVLTRKKRNAMREKHLKSFILDDPRMRDLYLEARKQNPKESEK
jgi:hypothetical protein